ncbi:MAG TPA: metal-dependent hydrolase [Candidatus Nanoarchaeia archaeon]|nr:metal-dependent hydrolase [Candidatus Nanoarchaeia archaeon]
MLGVQHELVGSVIGVIVGYLAWSHGHPYVGVICFLFAIWGANLPDILDPPGHFLHRSFGHNFISLFFSLALFAFSFGLFILFESKYIEVPSIIVVSFSAGFLSHLIMDAMTPMGLPMFVGRSIFGFLQIPLYLIPFINFIMFIVTIWLAYRSIKYIAKKIGGIPAVFLLFIPVWSPLLIIGMALQNQGMLDILGNFLLVGFVVCSLVLVKIGRVLDRQVGQIKAVQQ